MICNSSLTVYHYEYDNINRINKWVRKNYGKKDEKKVWFFGGKGSGINKGYENANDADIRIPYDINDGLNIKDFKIGDIVVQGTLDFDITTQQDLDGYNFYNITSINDNNFGNNQHIHIGAK